MESQRIYRVDGIEIDTSRVCLKRNDEELHLRQKAFQVLIHLLEQRPRLITKQELIDQIWQGAAVTDNTLEQCLAEIRRVLGDDSRNPRFIKTVSRGGYRFIAQVEEVSADRSLDKERESAASIPVEPAERSGIIDSGYEGLIRSKQPRMIRPLALAFSAVALIGIVVVGFYWLRKPAPSSLNVTLPQDAGKRPLAVMFFDNQSNSPELEWLREGLADMIITGLSRSKNLTVLSRQQLHILLDRLGHQESEKIQLDEALNIAQKSQAKIVILGSFARLGESIRIDVHIHDSRDGQLLTAERLVVDQPSQILTQVDLLSLKLASYLGATPSEQEANAGLASIITNNLEAYRYYSLAIEKARVLRNEEALELLRKAVALDPDFAMAHARIGYVYAVMQPFPEKAKPYLEKAYQLPNRLTEKDKLYITAWYAIANFDYVAAISSFRQIISSYPLELEAYWRLARLLRGEERLYEAIEIAKQGLVIDAGAKELYNTIGGSYSDLGRHDEAIAMYRRYVELAPEEPNAYDSLGLGLEWAGRYAEAIKAYEHALALKPDFEIAVIHLGNTYFQLGRHRDAITLYRRYLQFAVPDRERGRASRSIGLIYWNEGKFAEALRFAREQQRAVNSGVDILLLVALQKSDWPSAEKFAQVIESAPQPDRGARGLTRARLFYRGYFNLKTGNSEKAIETFKEALKHRPLVFDIDAFEDCLANALLELGRLDEAINEYQRILKLNPNYPLAHYHLGQAYERKGLRDQAHVEYESFLQVWKDADADLPEMIAARKAVAGELHR